MASKVFTATVDGIRSLQDRSLKLSLTTQELSPDDVGGIFGFQGQYCKVLITTENVTTIVQESVEATEVEHWERSKSPAQRLRAVLFKCWDSDKENMPDFDTYYKSKMEQIINHYKAKL